jgi:two-component sensor histidine kinase
MSGPIRVEYRPGRKGKGVLAMVQDGQVIAESGEEGRRHRVRLGRMDSMFDDMPHEVREFADRAQADAYFNAKKRVKQMREFYRHLGAYVIVNFFLMLLNLVTGPGKLWFVFPMLGWGVGLASHAFAVFGPALWFGQAWEEKKINELLAKEQIRSLSTEKQLVQAQMRMLQAQIEPHFLFNTLANVVSLVDGAPDRAKLMLENFIAYLRASLQASRNTQGTVAQEGELLHNYLELLKIRMGDRLTYAINISPEAASQPLSPMLLQPVVENAIKHGVEGKIEGGHISVNVWREHATVAGKSAGRLKAVVEDNGLGFSQSARGGVGLTNLRERLAVLYEGDASVTVEDRSPGCAVVLDLPFVEASYTAKAP